MKGENMSLTAEQRDMLKESARAQMKDSDLAGLLRLDEEEFQAILEENEDLRRDLLEERAKGRNNLTLQLYGNAVTGKNHHALRDALKGLCGLDLDPKASTKVEINSKELETKIDDIDSDRLYLIDRIYNSSVSKEQFAAIEAVLRK
jgi:hypothetical protein